MEKPTGSLATRFPEAKWKQWANFVVGVLLSVGAFPSLTMQAVEPLPPPAPALAIPQGRRGGGGRRAGSSSQRASSYRSEPFRAWRPRADAAGRAYRAARSVNVGGRRTAAAATFVRRLATRHRRPERLAHRDVRSGCLGTCIDQWSLIRCVAHRFDPRTIQNTTTELNST